jgi:hypothetical protein
MLAVFVRGLSAPPYDRTYDQDACGERHLGCGPLSSSKVVYMYDRQVKKQSPTILVVRTLDNEVREARSALAEYS